MVNSNIFIGIAAVMAVFQFYVLTDGQMWLGFLELVVFTGTVIVYNLHRLISLPKKEMETHSEMHAWMQRHRKLLIGFLVFLGLHTAVGFFLLNFKSQLLLAGLFLIALFYAVPFYAKEGKKLRIRDFGMFKPFVLGLTWATVTVTLPYFNSEQHIGLLDYGLIFSERFLFISALCIPFDIRDLQFDKKNMYHSSLPNRIGIQKSITLAKYLFLAFVVLSIFHYSYLQSQHFFSLASLISAGSILYLLRDDVQHKNEYFYTFYLDGGIIVQSLLICLSSYLNYQFL